jgi:hypothetical protein
MAKRMSWVKIRGFIAGVFALLLVLVLASIGTAAMGIDVPVLSTIAGYFGVPVAQGGS